MDETNKNQMNVEAEESVMPLSKENLVNMDSNVNNTQTTYHNENMEMIIDQNSQANILLFNQILEDLDFVDNMNYHKPKSSKDCEIIQAPEIKEMDYQQNMILPLELELPEQQPEPEQEYKTWNIDEFKVDGFLGDSYDWIFELENLDKIGNSNSQIAVSTAQDIVNFYEEKNEKLINEKFLNQYFNQIKTPEHVLPEIIFDEQKEKMYREQYDQYFSEILYGNNDNSNVEKTYLTKPSYKISDSFKKEIKKLDTKFKISFESYDEINKNFKIKCILNDDSMIPCLPSIIIIIPNDYPYDLPNFTFSLDEYFSSSFLDAVKKDLELEIQKVVFPYTVSNIIHTWEKSVRKLLNLIKTE